MRTTGGPAPDVSTCRDSVAATGTLKLWRSAVSASSATVRSQTIVPSGFEPRQEIYVEIPGSLQPSAGLRALREMIWEAAVPAALPGAGGAVGPGDRKSTRLNSSHSQISYAVFCLKKKKHK